jgi:hypothetical protein
VTKGTSRIVEGRWEQSDDLDFFLIEIMCGTLDDAQKCADLYLHSHHVQNRPLTWLDGDPDQNGPVVYAYDPSITFRIRQ